MRFRNAGDRMKQWDKVGDDEDTNASGTVPLTYVVPSCTLYLRYLLSICKSLVANAEPFMAGSSTPKIFQ